MDPGSSDGGADSDHVDSGLVVAATEGGGMDTVLGRLQENVSVFVPNVVVRASGIRGYSECSPRPHFHHAHTHAHK